ncbi:MAG: hypothetical protein ABIR17_12730 [Pseudolysinimonas sp.]|uniref:hypothetical protein n=1 Tax=Pseudolysinimonas sp. TaxID=2680009 RepID=UPI00326507B6
MSMAAPGASKPGPFGYDFSSFDEPMSRAESARRRREILQGRSIFSAMESEHQAALMLMVVPWFLVGVVVFSVWSTALSSLTAYAAGYYRFTGSELVLTIVLAIVVTVVGVAGCVFLTRLCIIPPRWRDWVRIYRFAELNGMRFIRVQPGVELPPALVKPRSGATRIFDTLVDERIGLTVGNWVRPTSTGRGIADWRSFILVRTTCADVDYRDPMALGIVASAETALDDPRLADFEIQVGAGQLSAVKGLPPVRMRSAATIRRMLEYAEALRTAADLARP